MIGHPPGPAAMSDKPDIPKKAHRHLSALLNLAPAEIVVHWVRIFEKPKRGDDAVLT